MEGQGQIAAQDRNVPTGLLAMQADTGCSGPNGESFGEWREATPPLIRCYQSAHSFNNGGLGPGDYFGRGMLAGSGEGVRIGLVGAAYQGQSINFFRKNCSQLGTCNPSGANGAVPLGMGGYQWLLSLAQQAQQDGVIKGIIFHQGESDTGQADWPQRVNEVVTNLRADLGIGNVPFIAGEMVPGACCTSHNTYVHQIENVVTNGHWVSASGLGRRDQYHFDAAGYRTLGQRYADKMLTLVDSSGGPLDCGTSNGSPVCCNISADDDGDGWGTQNGGEMCIVTPDTEGYIPPNPDDVAVAINVGSTQGSSYAGIYYEADRDFTDGEMNSTADSITGAEDSRVFNSERYGDFSYEIPLANGRYSVSLGLVELYWEAAGDRSLNIEVEGNSIVSNYDIFAMVGHDRAQVLADNVINVNDGSLSIHVSFNADNGTLSSILVRELGPASSSSSSQQSSSSQSSSQNSSQSSSAMSSSSSMQSSSSASSQPATTTGGGSGAGFAILLAVALAIRQRLNA